MVTKLRQRKKAAAFTMGRAWIELDMNNLHHNINVLRGFLPDGCQLMPVLKADAYGHGAVEIAKELNTNGIRTFCVATVLEGVELRKHGVKGEILILGYTHPKQFCLLRKYRLTQTVIDNGYAKALESYCKKLTVHIKIDTGMRRLGERSENIDGILQIFESNNLDINGIYTQLCAIDGNKQTDKDFTQMQIDNFNRVLLKIEEQGFALPKVHIQESYGIFNRPDLSLDYARVGIALYGMLYTLSDTERYNIGLRPVLSVKARVGAVKTLFTGEAVGYGLAFTTPHNMKIATLAFGYADGIPRCLSCGIGHVLINGQKAPIVGRICMDQMMVDVTGIEGVRQGDIAVIIGKSGETEITACEIAEQGNTVSTEILSRLGGRLEKYFIRPTVL
jgi:serine/alanine racemase